MDNDEPKRCSDPGAFVRESSTCSRGKHWPRVSEQCTEGKKGGSEESKYSTYRSDDGSEGAPTRWTHNSRESGQTCHARLCPYNTRSYNTK